MAPLSPEIISNLLKLKKLVGKGSSSTVYRVNNCYKEKFDTDKKYLAIKILHFDIDDKKVKKSIFSEEESNNDDIEKSTNKEKFNKILEEAMMIISLSHKNIAKFHGYCDGDKNMRPSIILEYCRFHLKEFISFLEDKSEK